MEFVTSDQPLTHLQEVLAGCARVQKPPCVATYDRTIQKAARQYQLESRLCLPHWTARRDDVFICTATGDDIKFVVRFINNYERWAVLGGGQVHARLKREFKGLSSWETRQPLRTYHGTQRLFWTTRGLQRDHDIWMSSPR